MKTFKYQAQKYQLEFGAFHHPVGMQLKEQSSDVLENTN